MNWSTSHGKLIRQFEFDTFMEAIAFINQIAPLAEQANHHPDISLHDYNKALISLITHEENSVTEKDRQLAQKIDELK